MRDLVLWCEDKLICIKTLIKEPDIYSYSHYIRPVAKTLKASNLVQWNLSDFALVSSEGIKSNQINNLLDYQSNIQKVN